MGGIEIFVGLAFLFAGFVKGAIGIGLPTVVMGLLSIIMPPAQAAGLMVLPALGTNIWQMAAGPSLGRLARRFATMIAGVFVGTFATIALLTASSDGARAALGLVLAAYGLYGLLSRRFEVAPRHEAWASPLMGVLTGAICGATGVFILPNAPYLTSLRMSTEELVQAIGILAFVCPLALTIALAVHGQYSIGVAGTSFLALLPALAGMYAGQHIRRRLPAATFMRWFFIGLVLLGSYMFLRSARLA
ncbi:MAG TPA: sulfite exporter TauE/SafE family protein [Burkholderiales bacterium]|nr:sulfite exporter TauE/SafE family protein [Burkholderiales bacterium]